MTPNEHKRLKQDIRIKCNQWLAQLPHMQLSLYAPSPPPTATATLTQCDSHRQTSLIKFANFVL